MKDNGKAITKTHEVGAGAVYKDEHQNPTIFKGLTRFNENFNP